MQNTTIHSINHFANRSKRTFATTGFSFVREIWHDSGRSPAFAAHGVHSCTVHGIMAVIRTSGIKIESESSIVQSLEDCPQYFNHTSINQNNAESKRALLTSHCRAHGLRDNLTSVPCLAFVRRTISAPSSGQAQSRKWRDHSSSLAKSGHTY